MWVSLVGLGVTAVIQLVVALASGSVALLNDTFHNFADAFTALPLWLAFSLGRRRPTERYPFGYGRAEDLAGIAVVAMIALSAAVAAWEAIDRLLHPQDVRYLGAVIAASIIGFAGNELVPGTGSGSGRRSAPPLWLPTAPRPHRRPELARRAGRRPRVAAGCDGRRHRRARHRRPHRVGAAASGRDVLAASWRIDPALADRPARLAGVDGCTASVTCASADRPPPPREAEITLDGDCPCPPPTASPRTSPTDSSTTCPADIGHHPRRPPAAMTRRHQATSNHHDD